ncbi:ABC transporter ATP-binding protein [Pseudalkalibacillus hwajinpoensis]|uniref:ABC transporter ATP-binding protein n=1 Tax=Guptibacillus hwajinpoensis TaxID=208199 RepID=A0A4U1MMT4_9BACL|nr:ABC transporter ATP-binding protein [Pseudalkalibacillus hwajinpoensis]TKD72287.1 ABC transporter ATP-binding protein [Pseudalkalibacillus hwajinpoensis]
MRTSNMIKGLKFVWRMGKYWILLSLGVSIITGLFPILSIYITKELVNKVSLIITGNSDAYSLALMLLGAQFLIMLLSSIVNHVKDYYDHKIGIQLDHELKKEISIRANQVPYSYYDNPEFYNHLERIESNSGSKFLSPIISSFGILTALITLVSLMTFLFQIHWSLLVISILIFIPSFIVKSYYGNKQFMLNLMLTPRAREASFMRRLLTGRENAKEIRTFRLADYFVNKWSTTFLTNAEQSLVLLKKQKRAEILLDGLTGLFYTGAAGIIIWLTKTATVKIGEFVAIGQAVHNTQDAVNQISMNMAQFVEDSLYINDYFSFMESQDMKMQGNQHDLKDFPDIVSSITLANVSFRYPNSEHRILNNISLRINAGEKIAIVGHNGSGKTTLIKCLLGLYQVTEGDIYFNDTEINNIKKKSLSDNTTVIFQDFIKYPFSIKENIVVSNVNDQDNYEKMESAAKDAGIHNDILAFEHNYDTILGKFLKEGEDLSGGQWQKVAMARALFKDSKVMILDEPTSALDPMSELEMFRNFKKFTFDKTAFFISHRMSAAMVADRIVVMKNGEIVEVGTHKQLIEMDGCYREMYKAQANLFTDSMEEVYV